MGQCKDCYGVLPSSEGTWKCEEGNKFCSLSCREAYEEKVAIRQQFEQLGQAKPEQVGGTHYQDMEICPAEYATKNKLGFLEGNVVKYVSRHRKKNGVEDLRKAIQCIELLIGYEYDGKV